MSELQPQRLRRELHQRLHRPARRRELLHECRAADLLLGQRHRRSEALLGLSFVSVPRRVAWQIFVRNRKGSPKATFP
jgi:hypothetical protein